MYQRILIAVDDSETSSRALGEAIRHAKDLRAALRRQACLIMRRAKHAHPEARR